jgi:arylsulfatase A-like enzyme
MMLCIFTSLNVSAGTYAGAVPADHLPGGADMTGVGRNFETGILFRVLALILFYYAALFAAEGQTPDPPNIIVIFCDDLGYGDPGCYGHPTIRTPNIDRLAVEGQRWTSFYAAASVCTPSRAGLLTGRLPVRSGMASDRRRVLFPDSEGGLPQSEITIAELLRDRGYATACIGKWHLGHLPEHLPLNHGFDHYFGIPYSNDMDGIYPFSYDRFREPKIEFWNVPLMQDTQIIERPADQRTITKRYTEESLRFIGENAGKPFFLYLAHSMPHVPLFASDDFTGVSPRGTYGDVLAEIDWSVAEILRILGEKDLGRHTLIVFSSDNGPWLACEENGGSAGLLRGGKGMTWEGGMRVPAIFWWPENIKPAVISEIGSTLDLLPTFAALAGADLPADLILDGYDLGPVLFEGMKSPRELMYFYRGTRLYALRKGPYKAHFITQWAYTGETDKTVHKVPLLYNLDTDPSERFDIAAAYPDVIAELTEIARIHENSLVPGPDQMEKRISPNQE